MRNLNNRELDFLTCIIEDKEYFVREDSTDERMVIVYTTIQKNDTQFTCNRADFDKAFDLAIGLGK